MPQKLMQRIITRDFEQVLAQVASCPYIGGNVRTLLEAFLMEYAIEDIWETNEETADLFYDYLKARGNESVASLREYRYSFIRLQIFIKQEAFKVLREEIDACKGISIPCRNKAQFFLMEQGVKHLEEIDYDLRLKYKRYLEKSIAASKVLEYVRALDLMKISVIKKDANKFHLNSKRWVFSESKFFLLYHPDPDIGHTFDRIQDKEELLWDFTMSAAPHLKQQIFRMLNAVLEMEISAKERRVRFLLPLKWFYGYCVRAGVEDIEQLEQFQIEELRAEVVKKVVMVNNSMQVVDNIRKMLFLTAKETNWKANVWYLERFSFDASRMNPSNPIIRISFLDVENQVNRAQLKEYIRYLLGITSLTIAFVRQLGYYIKEFLRFLDDRGLDACEVGPGDMEVYFRLIEEKAVQAETFNKSVCAIYRFFQFLRIRDVIEREPFIAEYYLKETLPVHHDRCLSNETIRKVHKVLKYFSEHLRLMYLHLWSLGLRVSEVCVAKGDSYHLQNGEAWIRIYQNKMKAEKVIPIPMMLYRMMKHYIEKNQIQKNDYVFQNRRGGAYHAGAFYKQMSEECKKHDIDCGDYVFRTHDYRHNVGTFLYNHGASIQAIRDYLGHESEEMTKQYIDYVMKQVYQKNEAYFNIPEYSLATALKGGDKL